MQRNSFPAICSNRKATPRGGSTPLCHIIILSLLSLSLATPFRLVAAADGTITEEHNHIYSP